MTPRLLIIDDEENMRHMLQALLSKCGYQIEQAQDGREGLDKVQLDHFDYVLCDVRMPRMDGMAFLEQAESYLRETTVVMMSAYGTVDLALEAMKKGAYDYISKPFKKDEVLLTLKKAEEREMLKRENSRLRQELENVMPSDSFGHMVGISKVMQELFELARRVACYSTTVLITGESGTGKELLARGIHQNSKRKDKPFIAINCGSIPEGLIESELFGHIQGSFTGADQERKGLFVEANHGTLFLDEIGEMPLGMQVKLLRVLQEGEVKPVGANQVRKIDVRILAATSQDLTKAVASGRFRSDLFYRLNVLHLTIPPLRQRKSDIRLLCDHFIYKVNRKYGCKIANIDQSGLGLLIEYDWPGNVRELENSIERACVLADTDIISSSAFLGLDRNNSLIGTQERSFDRGMSVKKATAVVEAQLIKRAMERTGGNKTQAAELLEMSYPSLLSKIKKYKI
ncbi:sigma-54-dependent transcriptional regulator [Desulfopila aestuarii]|uniref:Two component, sigma54 specific, transcriptional regulator, Fis family n=1 Tax=Desulfopila aestuarii DSM 18488 TaxID=1121416 RepID=A0A1M7Y1R5_9BACT|nr:sigma-54 dependent transcriptional regulator [Desulfopila aestuarii]SHO45710.1 two component, sigma54 specific, transcriptional regulator, Fis family [Desulfopila aestuarii DSM 18488]